MKIWAVSSEQTREQAEIIDAQAGPPTRHPSYSDRPQARRLSPEAKSDRLFFKVVLLKAPHHEETVRFKSCVGPGDHGELGLTIMLPDED